MATLVCRNAGCNYQNWVNQSLGRDLLGERPVQCWGCSWAIPYLLGKPIMIILVTGSMRARFDNGSIQC